ncbi:MAG: hypothetical protein IJT07_01780 [Oscillospiraceae bacterium]|nr:hypothetical protein [Oscillospiraceae bacterium]
MTCKTSCSNSAIFKKTIARFWPLWLGYLVVWLLTLPLPLSSMLSYLETITAQTLSEHTYWLGSIASPLIAFSAAPIAAMVVFSHLYNDKSCGAYASLPITRTSMFWQATLAGFAPLLVGNVITVLITAAVEASYGVVHWASLLAFLGYSTLHLLTFYGFAVLCAQLTGVLLVVPAVYAVLQFAALGYYLATAVFPLFLYGFGTLETFPTYLSPLVEILRRVAYTAVENAAGTAADYRYTYWGGSAIYAAIGVLLTVLASLLYRRRRMETAGDWVAVRPLKTVFRWCMAFGCSIILTLIVYAFVNFQNGRLFGLSPYFTVLIPALIGGFVGWFGAEMLMQKSFRVFDQNSKRFLVYACILIAALTAVRFDVFGYSTRIPNADDVKSVHIACYAESADFDSREEIVQALAVHNLIIQGRDENVPVENAYACYVSLDYELQNGHHLMRTYDLYVTEKNDSMFDLLESLMNSETALLQRRNVSDLLAMQIYSCEIYPDEPWSDETMIQLSGKEATELFQTCILPDILDGKMEALTIPYGYEADDLISADLIFTIRDPDGNHYGSYYFQPTKDALRTCTWLAEHGVAIQGADEYGVPTEIAVPETAIS